MTTSYPVIVHDDYVTVAVYPGNGSNQDLGRALHARDWVALTQMGAKWWWGDRAEWCAHWSDVLVKRTFRIPRRKK